MVCYMLLVLLHQKSTIPKNSQNFSLLKFHVTFVKTRFSSVTLKINNNLTSENFKYSKVLYLVLNHGGWMVACWSHIHLVLGSTPGALNFLFSLHFTFHIVEISCNIFQKPNYHCYIRNQQFPKIPKISPCWNSM